jgi:MFS family permease
MALGILILIMLSNGLLGTFRAVYVVNVLGGTATDAGVVGLWWTYGTLIVRFFVGKLSTRFGTRNLLLLGSIGYCITLTATALTMDIFEFTLVVVFQSLCHPFAYIASNTVLAESMPKDQAGVGTFLFIGIPTAISGAFGPALGQYFIDNYGFPGMFVLAGALMSVAVVLSVIVLVRYRRAKKAIYAANGSEAVAEEADDDKMTEEEAKQYRGIWGFIEKKAIGPMALMICGNLAEQAILMFAALYASEIGAPQNAVTFFAVVAIVGIIVTFGVGLIMDKFGLFATMLPAVVFGVVAYAIFYFGSTGIRVWIFAAIAYGVAQNCLRPTINAGMIKIVPHNRLKVAMSNFSLAISIGMGVTGIIVGKIIDGVGYQGVWLFCMAMYAVTFIISLFVFKNFLPFNLKKQQEQREEKIG